MLNSISNPKKLSLLLIVLAVVFVFPASALANQAPVADAGPDQTTHLGQTIQLLGTAVDPDGDPIFGWFWNVDIKPAGSTPHLSTPYLPNPDFKADMVGDYVLSLVACDIYGFCSFPDTVVIHVLPNNPPVADAGPDQNIYLGEYTVLLGSASDPDGDEIVSYLWTIDTKPTGSSPYLSNFVTPDPMFMADMAGDYVLSLVVSDGTDDSVADTVTIQVALNLPPVAVADADVLSGEAPLEVQFDGTQSVDPEGRPLTYQWLFGDGTPPSSDASPSHIFLSPGTFTVYLTVVDDLGQRDRDSIDITVTFPVNNPPVCNPSALPNSGNAPLTVQFAANASDPDGDALTYLWDFGDSGTSTLSDPEHTFASAGTYIVWLTVSDGELDVSESVTIVVESPIGMSVASASIDWYGNKNSMGKIRIIADITPYEPWPDEIISLSCEGIMLFAAPFSLFEHSADEANLYVYTSKHLFAKLDYTAGRLDVFRRKIDLSSIDDNSVDVELMIGEAAAVETIVMSEHPGRKLVYKR